MPFVRGLLTALAGLVVLSCTDSTVAPIPAVRSPGAAQFTSVAGSVFASNVVISQIYPGQGTTFASDYVEIFNRSAAAVDISGWSIQYGSATGAGAFAGNGISTLSGILQPGQYYLVRLKTVTTGGTTLTGFDVSGSNSTDMSGSGGKVILVDNSTGLACNGSSTSPCSTAQLAHVVDLVGYGGANFSEAATATAPGGSQAIFRAGGGCTDTDNNSADFAVGNAAPRNTSTTRNVCGSITPPPQPVLDHIQFDATSIVLGVATPLTAKGFDKDNKDFPLTGATWTSDNSAVTVGALTGVALGSDLVTATVTVTLGNVSAHALVTVTAPAVAAKLRITELYGNPVGDDTKGEWFEVYNAGSAAVDLFNYLIESSTSTSPFVETHTIASHVSIAAGACLVFGNNADVATNGGVNEAYSYGSSIVLNNSNTDWLRLRTPQGTATIDSVAYAIRTNGTPDASFNPFASDGVSWELSALSAQSATVQGGVWVQSTHVFNTSIKGTPGTCPPQTQSATSLSITTSSVNLGATKQLSAFALDQNGQPMVTQPTFAWASQTPAVLSVDAAGSATGLKLGQATVTASTNGATATATIAVVDPNAVGSIFIPAPDNSSYPAGYTVPLFPTASRGDGTAITPVPRLTWTATPALVTVDTLNYISTVTPGPVTITASSGSVSSAPLNLTILSHTAPTSAVYRDHLAFGRPTVPDVNNDYLITKPQYTLSYNKSRGVPNWVSWDLNASHFGSAPRCNCFTTDPDLPQGAYPVSDFDYRNGGYDRGHMTMSEERTTTIQENAATFILSNVIPQYSENNQGPWEAFEEYLNAQAQASGKEVYVIAGPQWGSTPGSLKNEGHVFIPDYTWKVAVIMNAGQSIGDVHSASDIQVIAVRMPNLSTTAVGIRNTPWQSFQTSVRSIEQATGYNLLTALPVNIQNQVETGDHAPVAAVTGTTSLNEGGTADFDASGSTDPDVGDTRTYAWNFGDGSTAPASANATTQHQFADNGTFTVTVTVTDAANVSSTATMTVSVANVAPTATFSAPATGTEGSALTLSLTDAADASSVDVASLKFAFDCGAGYGTPSSSATATCTPPDNGDIVMHAKVIDKDGGATEYASTVHVSNVAPTATFAAPDVNEGTAIRLSLTSAADASPVDAASLTYAFDCGTGNGYGAASATSTATCATDDNGTRVVHGKVIDKDGGATEYELSVSIANVAPTLDFPAVTSPNEGQSFTLTVLNVVDPSSIDFAALKFAFDCGDGGGFAAASAAKSVTCPTSTYGTRTVRVTVTDKDGASTPYSQTLVVKNVAPAPSTLADTTKLQGETYAQTVSFTDPGLDPWTASVSYGDGSAPQVLPIANKTFSVAHRYDNAGVFSLVATLSDGDATVTTSATVTIQTPAQGITNLTSAVDGLTSLSGASVARGATTLDKSGPSNGEITALKNKLRLASDKLANGDAKGATQQLTEFQHDLQTLVQSNKVTQAAIDPLLGYATRVIASINR